MEMCNEKAAIRKQLKQISVGVEFQDCLLLCYLLLLMPLKIVCSKESNVIAGT